MLGRLTTAFTVAATAAVATARPAAADDGESALSLSAGYASFAIDEHDPPGGALGVEFEYGIGEALWLRGALAGALYAADDGNSYGGQGSIGFTYAVDILKYVPYLHAGLGGAALGGGPLDQQLHAIAELGAGVDLLRDRGLSYGLWARIGSFLDDSAFFGAGARVTWRWGFF